MATIKENYVSFETAKLLKEKGFNWPTYIYWDLTIESKTPVIGVTTEPKDFNHKWQIFALPISCPTLQMAMKWLREVHYLYIQVMLDSYACGGHTGYYVVIQNTTSDFEMMLQDALDSVFYDTYEQACETAIKYCLESLI